MSGVPLGRPPKNISKSKKKQAKSDERIRNLIEGKLEKVKEDLALLESWLNFLILLKQASP